MGEERIFDSVNRQVNIMKCGHLVSIYERIVIFNGIYFSVIFSQVKQALGGRVRLIVSGGAPLSPDTHEFIKTCVCNTVVQGYGLTETCAAATAMDCKYDPYEW